MGQSRQKDSYEESFREADWKLAPNVTPRLPSLATRDCENKSLFSVSSHPVKTKKDFFFHFFSFLKETLARATRRLNFQG